MALFRTREAKLQEAFSVPQSLFYWKSSHDKEIDVIPTPVVLALLG